MKKPVEETPLAQLEDRAELEKRYSAFSDGVLRRWMEVVTGPHREAMEEILRRRGARKE